MASADERLLSPAFVRITGSALAYFIAIGVLAPVLPRYVEDELHGGGTAVGIAVGAFAVSAALLRTVVGRIGDSRGRRVLVLGGGTVAGVSVLGYTLATSLPALVGMRLLTGVGEAAMFVGAATAVQDLSPESRRGEAASYFSVAVYGGLGIGPLLGEACRTQWGVHSAWFVSALLCFVAVAVAIGMPRARPDANAAAPAGPRRLLHPAAVRPGVILALSTTAYAGFSAFVPLYVTQVGLSSSGVIFAEYAVAVLAVRVFGARLPDRLGSIRGGSVAMALQSAGLVAMCAWHSATGLYVSTFVYSMGVSLLYPSLFPLVVDNAPEAERSQAIATFTLFFDVSQGLGAFVLGIVVSLSSERWAFGVAGLLSLVGLALLRSSARQSSILDLR
ncbi:MAG TPA: MFS transporter [Acidimicrobiales bacterium]|jgi:MFS family permease|nr:MFS transporter [Acidimicrobiales bacterium]